MYVIKILLTLFVGIACVSLFVIHIQGWRGNFKSIPECLAFLVAGPVYLWGAFFGWNKFFTLIQ